ncbi:MAG: glycoside hydrolase family 97 protein [Bacteroidales bacterium]|nr:glycoside hydrolase family 97 protein [Bacteroidales bacterium]
MRNSISLCIMLIFIQNIWAEEYTLHSPNNKIEISLQISGGISYSFQAFDKVILGNSPIGMVVDGIKLHENPKVLEVIQNQENENKLLHPIVRQKSAKIPNVSNGLTIRFKGGFQLTFRAYDDGIAYRWETMMDKKVKVNSEVVSFNFKQDYKIWFPGETSVYSHQERKYIYKNLSEIENGQFCSTPALLDCGDGIKAWLSEANLSSYPGMFLTKTKSLELQGKFAGYPLKTETLQNSPDRNEKVMVHADYLAKTNGKRTFPWRTVIITDDDKKLAESEMIYKLAQPCRIVDPSWIKPGKVAWDWWNANNIYGVDFKAGINTQTYKYYIDFASKYNLDYIILDEGWYYLDDALKIKESMDVHDLIRYGKKKNVGIILWVTWKAIADNLDDVLKIYSSWGAKGVKVDFMQRDDQWMVDYYWRVAEIAAKYKLLVNFHGAYKPTGLRRTYPNVITREGVLGLEHCKWSKDANPEHNVTLPFVRMVAGPIDYTPGAMKNATKDNFRIVFTAPMSPTTRCHQLAMYVVFESPLQMLADNPSNYLREPRCMEFLSRVPTVWDETKVLEAKVSDYIITARRSGDVWYVGGMTDWGKRDFNIPLDFLEEGNYKLKIWKDGMNADRHASDFGTEEKIIKNTDKVKIEMVPGGGWVGIIEKIK